MRFITYSLLTVTILFSVQCGNKSDTSNQELEDNKGIPQEGWVIDPTQRAVGKITPDVSEEDLRDAYGKEHVKSDTIWSEDGTNFSIGTKLFANTKNEVQIIWENMEELKNPSQIIIQTKDSEWKTKDGIHIGTTLEELEKGNTKPFNVISFEYEDGGIISDWLGGKFANKYDGETGTEFLLTPSKPIDPVVFSKFKEDDVPSSHELLKSHGLRLAKMKFYF